jgi:hypothetical protein
MDQSIEYCIRSYSLFEIDRLFLTIEVSCHFILNEHSWNILQEKEHGTIKLPKGFSYHLVGITIGTTRGILHTKTENTPFNKYLVGLFNIQDVFSEDVIIKFVS